MVYKWKTASYIKADANEAGKQFRNLERTVGLTPKTVLEANRMAGSPLHNEFEWDDGVAAENYRLNQARHLLNCICTVSESNDGKEQTTRAFFVVSETNGYESLDVIVRNENKFNAMLETALRELSAFEKKYSTLSALTPVFQAAKEVRKEVDNSERGII